MDKKSIVDFLSPNEAAQIASAVNASRNYWVKRNNTGLYTLGAAAYLDLPTEGTREQFSIKDYDPKRYSSGVRRFNPILRLSFSSMYDRLLEILTAALGRNCYFAPEKALPGFHIFEHHPLLADPKLQVPHFDRQYECLAWPFPIETFSNEHVSFTLPLKLPSTGGGLVLWSTQLRDILSNKRDMAKQIAREASKVYIDYSVGEMLIHSGHKLHQIRPWKSNVGEQRITMQGHGILHKGQWLIYW